jgi:uncharacterized membrane protein HdeD (DUF308 family)
MIRLACLLGLVAVVIVVIMALDPSGPTAILFSFVGMPALAAGVLLYGITRWRDGALSWHRQSDPKEAR